MRNLTVVTLLLLAFLSGPSHAVDSDEKEQDLTQLSVEEVIARGELQELKDRIAAGTLTPNSRVQDNSRPLLMIAADHGQFEIAQYLLSEKADPDAFDNREAFWGSALHVAAAKGDEAMAKLLLGFSAKPDNEASRKVENTEVFSGEPIAAAVGDRRSLKGKSEEEIRSEIQRRIGIIDLLISYKAPLHGHFPPLLVAAGKSHSDIVKHLLDVHADPNRGFHSNVGEELPLHRAVGRVTYTEPEPGKPKAIYEPGNLEIVQMLLKAGAKKDAPNLEFETPAMIANSVLKGLQSDKTLAPYVTEQEKIVRAVE